MQWIVLEERMVHIFMLRLAYKWWSIKSLLLVMLVLTFAGCAHQKVGEHNLPEKEQSDLLAFQRLFIGENKIISTSNYILEYDYETGFEPVCDDLFCDHTGKKCLAYFAESARENYMRSYSFEYNEKLFLLNCYEGDTLGAEADSSGFTKTFYTELVQTDINGDNRKKVAEIPLYLVQFPSETSMAIFGNTLWVAGWKEDHKELMLDEVTMKSRFYSESTNVLYQINLDTFEYKEVMVWKTPPADLMGVVASEKDVYVNSSYALEDGYTNEGIIMHYSIDEKEGEQLLIDGDPRLVGIYDRYMYYRGAGKLYRYDSKRQKYTCVDENMSACRMLSDGIVGKVEGEGFFLLSFDGKSREKLETGDMGYIIAEIGDKIIYFNENKLFWVYRDELADSDEKGMLISSFTGAMYEKEGDLVWK